jgi:predicted Rossmann-fold nucleotide-binding protein
MSASKESKQISICVFCGAGEGTDPAFAQAARALADLFYSNNWSLGIALLGGIV